MEHDPIIPRSPLTRSLARSLAQFSTSTVAGLETTPTFYTPNLSFGEIGDRAAPERALHLFETRPVAVAGVAAEETARIVEARVGHLHELPRAVDADVPEGGCAEGTTRQSEGAMT